ncbi:MAG: SAM-dependent DNA methyltransferase [Candidatus Coproplasma sp.]
MTDNQKQTKSKSRVKDHGEVFTAEREVNAMLDLVKNETERIDSRFLEPACGNGNFLIKILERKLDVVDGVYKRSQWDWEIHAMVAASSLYGVELLPDNVTECRLRLFDYFKKRYKALYKSKVSAKYLENIEYLFNKNIICGDALTLLQADGSPIIFSEWGFAGARVTRRDFTMSNLLESGQNQSKDTLFDLQPEEKLPVPVKQFAAVNYLEIKNYA